MRKIGEEIRIGDNVTVTVLLTSGRRVKLGISGPGNVRIVRSELLSAARCPAPCPLNKE
jgi:carbon storage regulator CsrA